MFLQLTSSCFWNIPLSHTATASDITSSGGLSDNNIIGIAIGVSTFGATVIGIIVAAIITVMVAAWQKDKLKCCTRKKQGPARIRSDTAGSEDEPEGT